MYNFNLRLKEGVLEFRNLTWNFILANYPKYEEEINSLLLHYLERTPDKVQNVFKFDLDYLLKLFDKWFSKNSFSHCYIVRDLVYWLRRIGIEHERFPILKEDFNCIEYRYYVLLSWDRLRDKFDYNYEYDDYKKYDRLKEQEIIQSFKIDSFRDFISFYQIFLEIYDWKSRELGQFHRSLGIIIGETYKNDKVLGQKIISDIINTGNQTGFIPYRIYEFVWNIEQDADIFFNAIVKKTFNNSLNWFFGFLASLEINLVKKIHLEELQRIFKEASDFVYVDINILLKGEQKKAGFFKKCLEIIVKRIEQDDVRFMLDKHFFEEDKLKLIGNVDLIKKAYYQQDKIHQHFDYNFEGLLEIIRIDRSFLLEYIKSISRKYFGFHASDYHKLGVVWKLPNIKELMKEIFDYIADEKYYSFRDDGASAFYQNLDEHKAVAIEFLHEYLNDNLFDLQRVELVMNIARNTLNEIEPELIYDFLIANNDFKIFREIKWHNSFFMGNGGTIWGDVKATRWEKILSIFDKIKKKSYLYSKHKNYIKEQIAQEKRSADAERKRIFMYGD